MKQNKFKHGKIADKLVSSFGLDIENYPELVYRRKLNAVLFFVNNYLEKKPGDKDYMELTKVESFFEGLNDCLAILCEILMRNNKRMEAKGVFDRNKLTIKNFEGDGPIEKKYGII